MGAVKEKSDEMDSKKEWRRKQAEGRARASANAARVRMSERETAEKGASMYALYSNGFKDEEHIHCVVRVTWYCPDRTNHDPLISPRTEHSWTNSRGIYYGGGGGATTLSNTTHLLLPLNPFYIYDNK